MAKRLLSILFLCLMPFTLTAVEVVFVVDGLKSNEGSVIAGVFPSQKTFLKDGKNVGNCKLVGGVSDGKARVVCSLDAGTYGASVFHDVNGNGEMDKNFMGIPKEPYGFSNNAKGFRGPPQFKDAAFTVGSKDLELRVTLE